jgi:hypothetical protein
MMHCSDDYPLLSRQQQIIRLFHTFYAFSKRPHESYYLLLIFLLQYLILVHLLTEVERLTKGWGSLTFLCLKGRLFLTVSRLEK